MSIWEILLIAGCAALVISVITIFIVRKVKGKPTCDCGYCCKCCSKCNSYKKDAGK